MPRTEVIETTAGKVGAELARRGIGSDERVIITIEEQELILDGACHAHTSIVYPVDGSILLVCRWRQTPACLL